MPRERRFRKVALRPFFLSPLLFIILMNPAPSCVCNPIQRLILICVLAFFACGAMPSLARAQQVDASVRGQVTDPSDALVPGAHVTLRSAAQLVLDTTSGDYGEFRFASVPAGSYTLTVVAGGFQEIQRSFTLVPGQQLTLSIRLKIQIEHQRVAVSGEELDSSPSRTLGAVVFRGSDLDALAPDSQDLQQQLSLMSGSDSAAQFYVNGFTSSRLPPKSSIAEIRMNQDAFSAQYDAPGSSRIEITTKPGGDKVHGSLEMFGEDSPLNARNPYVTTQTPYSGFYTQGNIDGPVTKSSSWFLSGAQVYDTDQSFTHAVISSTGPVFTQTIASPRRQWEVVPRIDFQLGRVQIISLSFDYDHETQQDLLQSQLSLASQGVNTLHAIGTLQFSDTQSYGPHVLNVTRFQFIRQRNNTLARSGAVSIEVQGAFNGGGNNQGQVRDAQNQYEFQDHAAILLGDHLLHFGGRLRDTQDGNTSTSGFNGMFIFPSIQAYEITEQGIAQGSTPAQIRAAGGGASQFAVTTGSPQVSINAADLGLYLEDEWKLTPNMTLTPGLRFETQSGIPDHADFAPRVSYGWSVGAHGNQPAKVVLRAGAGLFYQRFTPDLILNAARQNGTLEQQYVVQDPDFYPEVPQPAQLGAAALPTIYRIDPRLHAPSLFEARIGVERQFSRRLFAHADYTWSRGIDLLLTRNINAPLPGTYDPSNPGSGTRPLGTLQNIYEYESEGASRHNELYVNARYTTKRAVLYGYYFFGYRNDNADGAASFPSNQYNLHADYGRAANDMRNRAYFGGLVNLPGKIALNPFVIAQSGAPFNITVGQDLNGDSQFNDRPAFAADLSRASVYRTPWGNFDADPLPGETIIPRNYGDGPATILVDANISRSIAFGPRLESPSTPVNPAKGKKATKGSVSRRFNLDAGLDVQNTLNHTNGGLPVGVLGSPLFGQSTSLATTRFTSPQANRMIYLHMVLSF